MALAAFALLLILSLGAGAFARPHAPALHHYNSKHTAHVLKTLERAHEELTYVPLPKRKGGTFALLVSGAKGWPNYRYQASVYRMYQVLRAGGVPESNIVVMHHDDVAGDPSNPEPGNVFATARGPDVYAGVPKDYTGEDVNEDMFLAALGGVADAAGGRKVVGAGPGDNLLLFLTGLAGAGYLAMPGFPEGGIWGDRLQAALGRVQAQNTLVVVAAPHGGEWVEGLLPQQGPGRPRMLVVSAAEADEDLWACDCQDPARFWEGGPCLGLEVPGGLMDAMEGFQDETVAQVLARATAPKSHGSTVRWFGSEDILGTGISEFVGLGDRGVQRGRSAPLLRQGDVNHTHARVQTAAAIIHADEADMKVVAGENATLLWLRSHVESLRRVNGGRAAGEKLLRGRAGPSAAFSSRPQSPAAIHAYKNTDPGRRESRVTAAAKELEGREKEQARIEEEMRGLIRVVVGQANADEAMRGGHTKTVVSDWRCYRDHLHIFTQVCTAWAADDALVKHLGAFAYMCNMHAGVDEFVRGAGSVCNPSKDEEGVDWIKALSRSSTMRAGQT